jgi:hypothetical protein
MAQWKDIRHSEVGAREARVSVRREGIGLDSTCAIGFVERKSAVLAKDTALAGFPYVQEGIVIQEDREGAG